jgi:hypothetical protein
METATVDVETYVPRGKVGSSLRCSNFKPHLPDIRLSTLKRVLGDIYRRTWRAATPLAGQDCHSCRTVAPHLEDANATVAGQKSL